MAKKRRAVRAPREEPAAKSVRYDIEQTFDDSEDEFYKGRDKVLLDRSPDTKRRDTLMEQEKDLQPSDEEVLGYDESEEDESVSEEAREADSEEDQRRQINGTNKSRKVRKNSSDEEIDEEDENEYEGDFGKNKSDYYDADVIETAEDALEEEREARRLDQKRLQKMSTADFGFNKEEWATSTVADKSGKVVVTKLPEVTIPVNATDEQKLEILRNRYPEFEPLAAEFNELQILRDELAAKNSAQQAQLSQIGATLGEGVPVKLKYDALCAYLGSLAMYFAVMASSVSQDEKSEKITALAPLELQDHTVISSLMRARTLWTQIQAEPAADIVLPKPKTTALAVQPVSTQPVKTITAIISTTSDTISDLKKKARSEQALDSNTKSANRPSNSKPKTKKPAISSLEAPLSAPAPTDSPTSPPISDYGDESPLTASELATKAAKKKSLRFYTSQLASKASRRGHAGREAGGDDDLPYKERNRDRIERLQREAERRGQAAGDQDLDGRSDDDDDMNDGDARKGGTNGDVNDDYYETLLATSKTKKGDKAARAAAYAEAAASNARVEETETVGPDGKRAITYAIAKNKGLAPRRKKEVRNPRVKKKMKYEEKMKKLGSVRQLYKGGEGRGGYGGELTGIKTGIVRSVKL